MNKNKKGFISMTLVYTFLIVFLFLMLAILRTYNEKDKFLEAINSQIDNDISSLAKVRTTFIGKLLEDNTPISDDGIRFFSIANSSVGNGNGLFYTEDSFKTDEDNNGETSRIYFFRGDVDTNHIIFANKCWRIIRTNEDGSVRIRYNGIVLRGNKCASIDQVHDNTVNVNIGITKYQLTSNQRSDVSYIDNETNASIDIGNIEKESEVKKVLDNWYVDNIVQVTNLPGISDKKWSEYVSTSIFCNDRSVFKTENNITYFKSVGLVPRFINEYHNDIYNNDNIENNVSFMCESEQDRFDTVGTGNNLLMYPIGLLTAQDMAFSGAYMTYDGDLYNGGINHNLIKNTKFYLYTGKSFWTMSPFSISDTEDAKMVYVDSNGTMRGASTSASHAIIPVISLKSSTLIASGNGTSDKPYIIDYYN